MVSVSYTIICNDNDHLYVIGIVSDGKSGETDHSTQHCESLWSTIPLYGHQTEAVVLPCNPAHKTNI